MTEEREDQMPSVKEVLDQREKNLLTAVGSLAFLCVCLFVAVIALSAYALDATNEREAVSIALDDQRHQYYVCIRDYNMTSSCDQELISPSSRDIKRNLEDEGFSDLLYGKRLGPDAARPKSPVGAEERPREAFGLLGYVIYGDE